MAGAVVLAAAGLPGWARPRRPWNGTGRRCCAGPSASSPARRAARWSSSVLAARSCPSCPNGTTVVDDPREGKGPVQGIAAGLAALAGQARDRVRHLHRPAVPAPRVHPAGAPRPRQPEAASRRPTAYGRRTSRCRSPAATRSRWPPPTAPASPGSPSAWSRRTGCAPRSCSRECAVTRLDDAALLTDPVLAALDPDLDSVLNVNTPDDYQQARGARRPR